jgi:hypothetical protein
VTETARSREFAEMISRVLPEGYRVHVSDLVYLVGPNGTAGSSAHWLTTDVLLEDEAIGNAVHNLDSIQTEIAEVTREPWPARSGPGYGGFPEPGAELVGDRLRLWYGPREAPVLDIGSVDLHGVLLRE